MALDPETPEEKIVDNYFTDTLYSSREFKGGVGKFFTIVSKDENNVPNEIDIEHSYPYPIRNKIKNKINIHQERK